LNGVNLKKHLIFLFLSAIITFIAYRGSFNNSFVYDDYAYVVNNPAIKQINAGNIGCYFTDRNTLSSDEMLSKDNWRPIVTTSFAIDYRLWRLNPGPYHAENALLHVVNVMLLYALTFLVLNNGLAAFLTSVVFGIHPVQTEAVVWISGRSNLLFLLFLLSSFLFHIRNRKQGYSAFNYSLSLIFFLLSLLSKEMAVTAPLLFIAYDLFFHKEKKIGSYVSYYFPFFLVGLSYIVTRSAILGSIAQQREWWGEGVSGNVLLTIRAVAEYVRLLVWPANLGIEYPADIPKAIFTKESVFAVLILSAVAALWVRSRKKREILFYLSWFFIALIPVYNIVPFKAFMAERFLYLPSIAFASLFGIVFSGLISRSGSPGARTAIVFVILSVFIIYAYCDIARNSDWKNEITLYAKEVSRLPLSPRAHYNLGNAYTREAQCAGIKSDKDIYYREAIKRFNETLGLTKEPYLSYSSYANLAEIYNDLGRHEPAVENFKKAKHVKEAANDLDNKADLHFENKEYNKALRCCREALLKDPKDVRAYINLGNIYLVINESAKAKRAYHKAEYLSGKNIDIDKIVDGQ
jgi:hypothetical protein